MKGNSAHRVSSQTAPHVNQKINREIETNIAYFAAHPEQIDRRLEELDREWDVERALETGATSLSLLGLLRTFMGRPRWLLLTVAVQGFFLQHAIQGWCPPLEVFRRMGFRTRSEIDQERYALKALRGDFREVPQPEVLEPLGAVGRVFDIVRR